MIPQRIGLLVSLWWWSSYYHLFASTHAFLVGSTSNNRRFRSSGRSVKIHHDAPSVTTCLSASRYGPPSSGDDFARQPFRGKDEPDLDTQKREYRNLLESILSVQDAQHIPSLLTKNLDLLLSLVGNEGATLVKSVLEECRSDEGTDSAKTTQIEEAIEITLSFAEDFVQQASQIDQQNKELLGKILKAMSGKDESDSSTSTTSSSSSLQREEQLDALFANERDQLTAGFLRHVEAECDRIAAAPTMTPDSARLLETLRIIQARVVEELGQDLGEAAQVLGQLIGYESSADRLAVLEAGLTVRGLAFARELKGLTEEALEGFQRVPVQPDPELVQIVQEIDDSLTAYMEDHSKFE